MGGTSPDFLFLFNFCCSADNERDWPPCLVPGSFFGSTINNNTLNVSNNGSYNKSARTTVVVVVLYWRLCSMYKPSGVCYN